MLSLRISRKPTAISIEIRHHATSEGIRLPAVTQTLHKKSGPTAYLGGLSKENRDIGKTFDWSIGHPTKLNVTFFEQGARRETQKSSAALLLSPHKLTVAHQSFVVFVVDSCVSGNKTT
jgi:hypothetical protein